MENRSDSFVFNFDYVRGVAAGPFCELSIFGAECLPFYSACIHSSFSVFLLSITICELFRRVLCTVVPSKLSDYFPSLFFLFMLVRRYIRGFEGVLGSRTLPLACELQQRVFSVALLIIANGLRDGFVVTAFLETLFLFSAKSDNIH